jgi:aryl-alcohol dehydrogenase
MIAEVAMKTEAAVARAPKAPLSLEQVDLAEPEEGELLIRLEACGICHTDIAMRDQVYPVPQPIVLGHEGAGIVEAVGAGVEQFSIGDHVVISFGVCDACRACISGARHYCDNFFALNFAGARLDGSTALRHGEEIIHSHFFGQSSFARHAIVRARNAVRIAESLSLEQIAPLACGIMTGAGAVMNVLQMAVGDSIAIFGIGTVGLSAVMAASASGANTIIAVDVNERRLPLAREVGATHLLNPMEESSLSKAIYEIEPGGVKFALDTTARAAIIEESVLGLSASGTCGLLGAFRPTDRLSLPASEVMTRGKRIRGIVEGEAEPTSFVPKLIELNQTGRFPYERLLAFYPFERINDAIHGSEAGEVVKAVIRF